jgi:exo-beta-1,3-glucanase (GH17 family)
MQGFVGSIMGTIGANNNLWGPGAVTLTGPVTIPAGITLTVNPGTRISGNFPINGVGGAFVCNGTFAAPATIFGSTLQLTGGTHSLKYCLLNSQGDIALDVDNSKITLSHVQIQRFNKTGVSIHGAAAKAAIDFSTLGSASTLFTGDDATKETVAVLIAADAANGGSTITNSVLGFLHNASNTGLRNMGTTSNARLAYDFISGTHTAVVTQNVTGLYYGEPGVTDIPNLDFHLAFFSPALDLADPAVDFSREPAPNGGRANLGYYGGTAGARITSVQILSPNGCEEIAAGSNRVTWRSSPNTGPKTLEYSPNGGMTWSVLTKITMDTGSATVTVPAGNTDRALFRISQDNDPTHITDVSDRVVAVGMPKNATACAVPVRCPPGTANCKYFKVICYTGYRDGQAPTNNPATEPTQAQVLEDLTMLAKFTHGIRTYGSNPLLHDGGYVPGIADSLKLALHMGIWLDFSYTDAVNYKAIDDGLKIVSDGHPSIRTLIVGNEFLLRVRQKFGDTKAAEAKLVEYVKYVRGKAPMNIEVVTAESYPDWLNASAELFNAVDAVLWHVHPWWEQKPIGMAAAHVDFAHTSVVARMKALGVNKPERLAETGYPWAQCNGAACGSEPNQSQYLKDLHAYSSRTGLEYWFFEAFDEAWKGAEGGVGSKWGLYTTTRTPHAIVTSLASLIEPQQMWPPQ